MNGEGFTRDERILKKHEFQRVFDEGRKVRSDVFSLFFLPSNNGGKRIGIIASRKVGNAVKRNRAKRLLREIFRKNKGRILEADLVVVVYPSVNSRSYQEIERAFFAAAPPADGFVHE